jgi:hypothetical protein
MACGGGGKSEHCPELVDIVAGSVVIHDEQGGRGLFHHVSQLLPSLAALYSQAPANSQHAGCHCHFFVCTCETQDYRYMVRK